MIWAYWPTSTFKPAEYTPIPVATWPTTAWPRSSPEAQGMSSQSLLEMAVYVRERAISDPEFYVDSMTVIRNGTIVAEFYPNPNFPPNTLHVIHSVTKSIVSALVGIAIDRGLIDSVDAPLVDFFPDREIAHLDDDKKSLTLRDLLTMQTGLHSRDSYLYGHEGLLALQRSDDWVQYALDLPMAAPPGTRFDYSNISTFLLGAVLGEATNSDVLSFAREVLFDPLGIGDVRWEWTQDDIPIAWARMWLTPNDLAKLGLLYLQRGQWDGEQIIPAAWINESLTPHAFPKNAINILNADMTRDSETSTRNWVGQQFFRAFNDGYGYQWWLARDGTFAAFGTNGQFLIVAPQQNLIFVVTSKSTGLAQFAPAELFYDYVLPAVLSEPTDLRNTPQGAPLSAIAKPKPATTPTTTNPLPSFTHAISGKTFAMQSNPYNTDNIRFVFDKGDAVAALSYTAREDWAPHYLIGLDGIPRRTQNESGSFVALGNWIAPNTLQVDVEIVGYTTFDTWDFTFEGYKLRVLQRTITGDYSFAGAIGPR